MTYEEVLRELGQLGRFGVKLGLGPIREILGRMANPHLAFPTVHIAGTNGKGSTAHFVASILRRAGLRTGLYTSPHLLRFTERFQVNGEEVGQGEAVELFVKVRAASRDLGATFFETSTAMAMAHFAERAVDVAVIEVGLGGRLDATNVVEPVVSAITSIGLEHREHLGETLEEIAAEKAGIIKRGRPVVTGPLLPEAMAVVERLAAEREAPIFRPGRDWRVVSDAGRGAVYEGASWRCPVAPRVAGAHQVANAALAVATVETFAGEGFAIDLAAVTSGIAQMTIVGRFMELAGTPSIVLDAAHNPAAAEALAAALLQRFGDRPRTLVTGVVQDKDFEEILEPLLPHTRRLIALRPATSRAREPEDLVAFARSRGVEAHVAADAPSAVASAREHAGSGVVVVTGSFYLLASVLPLLGEGGAPDPVPIGDPASPRSV